MEHEPDFRQLFFPYACQKQADVAKRGTRFVHYTSAEAAMKILRNREFWMRKSSCMNDYTEVEHGIECLAAAYRDEHGKRLRLELDGMFQGISTEIAKRFDAFANDLRAETYVVSVSEHDDSEDSLGRLSMWRAYGGATGVALVLNNEPFLTPSDALKAYANPVAYLDEEAFGVELQKITCGIRSSANYVRALGRESIAHHVLVAFKLAALCTKHPGFQEEREWRVVYCPTFDRSEHITKTIEIIRGIPQPVCKIPLRNIPHEGFFGAEIPELIDRVIIGPSAYPTALCEAFAQVLFEAGVHDSLPRISVSKIPLRC